MRLRHRLHSCSANLGFSCKGVSIVTRNISNRPGLTRGASPGGQHSSPRPVHVPRASQGSRVTAEETEFISALLTSAEAHCPHSRTKSASCRRAGSLHELTFQGSGRAGPLPWLRLAPAPQGLASLSLPPWTRPGIVLLVPRSFLARRWMNARVAATGIVP